MKNRLRHPLLPLAAVSGLTLPWLALQSFGLVPTLPIFVVILVSGISVIGAAFVLTWGAEPAELAVPLSFALAVLAVIAVAPECAVAGLCTWGAGAAAGRPA
jgi:cation:H+ antiporter